VRGEANGKEDKEDVKRYTEVLGNRLKGEWRVRINQVGEETFSMATTTTRQGFQE
jgi:hypothetical protein